MINHVYGLAVRVLLTDQNGKILILKRSSDSKTNPGKWELPGGKVNQEESFDHALIREVYEETNLKIELEHVVGASEQNLHIIRAVHIIMSGKIIEGKLTLSREHEGYAWVLMETLSDYELADWLEDYVNQRNIIGNPNNIEDKENSENTITPWIKSIKSTVDKMSGKK
ncbi:NUDIX domain-containing protein [Methanobacterium sp. SMA-27]|uniref:NUDIX hydrolase n=1 Tax=Methanobacterium sp. SMA-27 TaxID=1495336 RepID=UPI00064FB390|nr:NUDIX domain-containing protein [Methanobacterium sp. SMA-27]